MLYGRPRNVKGDQQLSMYIIVDIHENMRSMRQKKSMFWVIIGLLFRLSFFLSFFLPSVFSSLTNFCSLSSICYLPLSSFCCQFSVHHLSLYSLVFSQERKEGKEREQNRRKSLLEQQTQNNKLNLESDHINCISIFPHPFFSFFSFYSFKSLINFHTFCRDWDVKTFLISIVG